MVDGNYAVNWASDSCFRTEGGETYPWWMVDLGQVRSVSAVKIWNRADNDDTAGRLEGFEIWIGNLASSYSDNMRCQGGEFETVTASLTFAHISQPKTVNAQNQTDASATLAV